MEITINKEEFKYALSEFGEGEVFEEFAHSFLSSVLGDELLGYDTGCGNVLMDLWINEHQGLAYDKEGSLHLGQYLVVFIIHLIQ